MKSFLLYVALCGCAACCAEVITGHVYPLLTGIEHTGDFKQLFGSSKVTDEVFGIVTRFMDTEAKADFLHLFEEAEAGLNGFDHRAMGHVLDGGYIRKEAIERIMEKCPGLTREEVLRRLVKYNPTFHVRPLVKFFSQR